MEVLNIILSICSIIVMPLVLVLVKHHLAKEDKKKSDTEKSLDLLKIGVQAGLRNDLLDCYYKCKEKGYRSKNDSDNFKDMYEAYHNLGGNSFIDNDVKTQFYSLPWEKDVKRNKGEE